MPLERRRLLTFASVGALGVLLPGFALGQTGQKRIALILANQGYQKNPLPNILNDANLMEDTLKRIGFSVLKGTDLSRAEMLAKLRDFRAQIAASPGCIALVYYSGHGAQVNGENYLIPIQNGNLSSAEDLPDECVAVGRVQEAMGKSEGQLNVLILDACRDNPFPGASKSQGSKGLAVVARSAAGTLIAFAASPGETASANPSGKNSLFTQELVKHLVRPGLSLDAVFRETRRSVSERSGGKQIPQDHNTLVSEVFLAGGGGLVGGEAAVEVKQTSGRLTFAGLPVGASVTVDGKSVSGESYEEDMSSEKRKAEIVAIAPGFKRLVASTTLERGKALTVRLPLEKLPEPAAPAKPAAGKAGFVGAASKARAAGCPELASYLERMQAIPGGTFSMGSEDGSGDEKPVHSVRLSDYWLGRTLVPQELWSEYATKGGGSMPSAPSWGWLEKHPVVNVSWDDIQGFCQWASGVSGVTLRLPTEAEWEYASRGGGKSVKWPWGNAFDADKLVWSQLRTATVDRTDRVYVVRFSNGSELLDMSGNVWQWCGDYYGGYSSGAQTNPTGPSSGTGRVVRGGSWYDDGPVYFRCAYRVRYDPDWRGGYLGFRLSSPGP